MTNKFLTNLQDQRLHAVQEARVYAERAAKGAVLSGADEAAYRRANSKVITVGKMIDDEIERESESRDFDSAVRSTMDRVGFSAGSRPEARYGRPLHRDSSFTELTGESRTISEFGEFMRAFLRDDVATRASMVEGTNTTGGYYVPTNLGAPLLDLVRNKAQVMRAGATVIPMDTQKVNLPRHDADPVAAWRSELGAISESVPTIGSVPLIAQSLDVMVRVSIEVLEDSSVDVGPYLANVLAAAFAVKLDVTALTGTGTPPEPKGVKLASGVTITNFVGVNGGSINATNGDFNFLVDAVGRLRGKNYDPTGILYSSRTGASLGKLKEASTNAPLAVPPYLDGIPRLETNQIGNAITLGTSVDTSDAYVADWSKLIIGLRTDFSVQRLSELYAATGEIGFWGHLRADVQVARAGAFEIVNGLRP